MAVSNSYLTFVMEQLGGVPRLVTKRMFGGVGIYAGEAFFAVLDNDTLFFKVDDLLRPQFAERGMPAFQPIPGKAAMTGYFQVPPDVLEDSDELARWAAQSIDVGRKGPGPTPPRSRVTRAARSRRRPARS
jgi:DNA transformation protein